jgi:hypothetical protein
VDRFIKLPTDPPWTYVLLDQNKNGRPDVRVELNSKHIEPSMLDPRAYPIGAKATFSNVKSVSKKLEFYYTTTPGTKIWVTSPKMDI